MSRSSCAGSQLTGNFWGRSQTRAPGPRVDAGPRHVAYVVLAVATVSALPYLPASKAVLVEPRQRPAAVGIESPSCEPRTKRHRKSTQLRVSRWCTAIPRSRKQIAVSFLYIYISMPANRNTCRAFAVTRSVIS